MDKVKRLISLMSEAKALIDEIAKEEEKTGVSVISAEVVNQRSALQSSILFSRGLGKAVNSTLHRDLVTYSRGEYWENSISIDGIKLYEMDGINLYEIDKDEEAAV